MLCKNMIAIIYFEKPAISQVTRDRVEPLFRGHPGDQGKCPLNGGWAEVC